MSMPQVPHPSNAAGYNEALTGPEWLGGTSHEGDQAVSMAVYAPNIAATLAYASQPDVAASDVHFRADSHTWLRRGGDFRPEKSLPVVTAFEIECGITWCGGKEIDATKEFPEGSGQRWRVKTFWADSGPKIVFRRLPTTATIFEHLGPSVAPARVAAQLGEGLIVVAGATGSGKSTTMTALVSLINQHRPCHILTIEDPIEVQHKPDVALVEQREVGTHVGTAKQAFKSALRSDPDVIVLGELLDDADAELCLDAAVSGHLVLTTMHAKDTGTVCERLLAGKGESARSKLAQAFQMVIAQRLVPDISDKYKRHLIAEICTRSTAIINTIRPGGDLSDLSQRIGDVTKGGLNARLAEAVHARMIGEADGARAAIDQNDFRTRLRNLSGQHVPTDEIAKPDAQQRPSRRG